MKEYYKVLGKVVPTMENLYDINKSYEKLTIIYDKKTNASYISKIDVPNNIEITNEQYWQLLCKGVAGEGSIPDDLENRIIDLETATFPLIINSCIDPNEIQEIGTTIDNLIFSWIAMINNKKIDYNNAEVIIKSTGNEDIILTNEESNKEKYEFKNIINTTKFTININYNNRNSSSSNTITFVKAMYFGFDGESIDNFDNLYKQSLKINPIGNYTIINNKGTSYLWLCIPNNMTINKVKSGDYEVPMNDFININDYKCYRMQKSINDTSINITIS